MFMRDPAREAVVSAGPELNLGLVLAVVGVIIFGLLPTPVIDIVQHSVLALAK
jgi:NADH:ubiquinone oxidoreductase subunit 2 (subunit N)